MKALSFKQPWAWLVVAGIKDVENRTWWLRMPPFLNSPENPKRIYVHASKVLDDTGWNFIRTRVSDTTWQRIWNMDFINSLNLGAIIGEVDIVACFHISQVGYPATKSPWFTGPYGLVLANPVLYEKPIPCKGRLGFFEPEITLHNDLT